MQKTKIGVIFGGMSTENEVSVVSAKNILENLDKTKYEIYPIYIDKKGTWYEYKGKFEELEMQEIPQNLIEIENIVEYLRKLEIAFPVLHGLYGEDGAIQGMFEMLKIPYVGCNILASSIGMDKVYAKILFEKAGINIAKSCYIKKHKDRFIYVDEQFNEEELGLDELARIIEKKLEYPMFVKPSNSGSSVGINKVHNSKQLISAIEEAEKYDYKILVEQGINGREVECAVLEKEDIIAGEVGEIKAADEFYSYDAKYNKASKTIIPADITEEQKKEVQRIAIKAFKAIDAKGLSRVDFFIENGTNKVYLNEINTMPGFTQISMYPKLMEAYGIPYKKILDDLIKV